MLGLSQAVELNNHAVEQLQAGELRQATITLREAVASIRQVVCGAQRQQQEEPQGTNADELGKLPLESKSSAHILSEKNSVLDESFTSSVNLDGDDISMDVDSFKALAGINTVQTMPIGEDDDSLYINIYDQAFSINQGEERDDLICTVIFYNLALVQHKRNMNHGSNLYKVLSIYQRAETVAQNLPYEEDEMILLLLLAINNNKMQIHASLFDRASLHGSLMQMQMLVGERPCEDDLRFEFFVLNSICFGEEQWRCAPVAWVSSVNQAFKEHKTRPFVSPISIYLYIDCCIIFSIHKY